MNQTIDNSQWPLASLLVSQERQLIYTPIAKNASTSLKRIFVRLSGHPENSDFLAGSVHQYLNSHRTGLSLCDYSQEDASTILNDAGYFRFVMLRNPLARVKSGYLDKFVFSPSDTGKNQGYFEVIKPAIDWTYALRSELVDYEKSISFEEFVDYLVASEDTSLDTHFKSQCASFLHQYFDFMGAIENMRELTAVLGSYLGQEVEIEHENRTRRKASFIRRRGQEKLLPGALRSQRVLPNAEELFTDSISGQLNQRFALDFQHWEKAMLRGLS